MNTRFLALGLIAFSFISSTSTSFAQNSGNTQSEVIPKSALAIFQRDHYQVEVLDEPYDSLSKFTLRLSSFGTVSGCASMTKPQVDTKNTMESVSIEVTDSEIRLDNKNPRYSNYDCEIKENRSSFDVVLDRDELIENEIKYIKLSSEKYGEFTTSEIEVSEEKLIMKIPTTDGEFQITHWFLPENTVILNTPYAKAGTNTIELLKAFAQARGLEAVDEYFKGYLAPHSIKHQALFIDKWNRTIPTLENPDKSQVYGQITATRTVYGINGPVDEPEELDVYISLPKQSAALIKK